MEENANNVNNNSLPSSPLLIKDVLQNICSYLDFSNEVILNVSVISKEIFILICSFEKLIINVKNIRSTNVVKHDLLLKFLKRRSKMIERNGSLVTLSIVGQTLPINIFAKIIKICNSSNNFKHIILSSKKIISGSELIIPSALALENESIMKLSNELYDNYDFINYMEELDIEKTGVIITLAKKEAKSLKRACLNLYESCINFCTVATNFKFVLNRCDNLLSSLRLVEYTYQAYLWLDDMKKEMNRQSLDINNLYKQCIRFQNFLKLLDHQVDAESLNKLKKLPCYNLLFKIVNKYIEDCQFLSKILSNTDEANLALDFLTSNPSSLIHDDDNSDVDSVHIYSTSGNGGNNNNLNMQKYGPFLKPSTHHQEEEGEEKIVKDVGVSRKDSQNNDEDINDSDDETERNLSFIDDRNNGNDSNIANGKIDQDGHGLTIGKALEFYNKQGESLESLVSLSSQFREMSMLD